MSKQHHYIVSYNTARNEWELDAEAEHITTTRKRFTVHMKRGYNGDGEFYPEAERLSEAISKEIKKLNKGIKK
jgi:hypothetical protein